MTLELIDKVNERSSGSAISNEAHVIGEDDSGLVYLKEVPQTAAGVTIAGFTRVSSSPASGQFIAYDDATGGSKKGWLEFNAADDGTAIQVSYTGVGSVLVARDLNRVHNWLHAVHVDVQEYGAAGDDSTDDAAAIQDALDALSSGGMLHIPAGTYRAGTNLSFASDIAVMLAPGAILKPTSGITITINGPILSRRWQIFDTSLSGSFAFGEAAFDAALPEWWGAEVGDSTDCSAAITAADLAAGSITAKLSFGPGTYKCSSSVLGGQKDYTRWEGVGHGTVLKTYSGAGTIGFDFANTDVTPIRGLEVRGIWFLGGQGEDAVVRTAYALDGRFVGCRISDGSDAGMIHRRPQNMVIEACEVRDNGGWGAQIDDFASNSGQTCRILHNTFFNNGATDGATGGLDIGTGGEHLVAFNQFESHNTTASTQAIRDTTARTKIECNIFENNSINVHLGDGTSTSRRCWITRNSFQDGKFYAQNYRNFLVENNTFGDSLDSWTAEFGADEGNSLSIWRNNYEDPNGLENSRFTSSAQVGKIQIEGSWDQTVDGRLKVFADGDTDPSVAGGYYFETANSGATSITKFDDWFPGQMVFVRMGDDNTTFVRNVNTLETGTEGNITPLTGDVLFFKIVRREPDPGSVAHKAYLLAYLPLDRVQAASSGTFTVLSASTNNANTTGWYQVSPGIWVPYTTDPTP